MAFRWVEPPSPVPQMVNGWGKSWIGFGLVLVGLDWFGFLNMFRVELVRAWVGFGVGWIGLGF